MACKNKWSLPWNNSHWFNKKSPMERGFANSMHDGCLVTQVLHQKGVCSPRQTKMIYKIVHEQESRRSLLIIWGVINSPKTKKSWMWYFAYEFSEDKVHLGCLETSSLHLASLRHWFWPSQQRVSHCIYMGTYNFLASICLPQHQPSGSFRFWPQTYP